MSQYLKLILFVVIGVILCQCVATKKQRENFLAKHCERKDSISYVVKDSLVYKDSLIFFPLEVNTPIYLENPCKLLCDSLGRLKPFDITKGNGKLKSNVKSFGNGIMFNCQTDSLKARIKWLEHNVKITEKSHTENTVKIPCERDHKNKFDGFTYWWFIITGGILLLFIIYKAVKSYFKLPF